MNRLTSACFLSVLIVCAIVAAWSSHAASPPDAATRTPVAEIKDLQQQRIVLLGKAAKMLDTQYRMGSVDFTDLKAAEREWLEARLDAAEAPPQRIAVLEEFQKSVEELVKAVEGRYTSGRCSKADLDRAKASLLDVRIRLLRQRQTAGAEKK